MRNVGIYEFASCFLLLVGVSCSTRIRRGHRHCNACVLRMSGERPPPGTHRFLFLDASIRPWLVDTPYMRNTLGCGGAWFTGGVVYPTDAPLLSLGAIGGWRPFDLVGVSQTPALCLKTLSESCRMRAASKLILNVTDTGARPIALSACHYSFNHKLNILTTVCCTHREGCRTQPLVTSSVHRMLWLLDATALLMTLISPLVALKLKIALQYSSTVKFFRASLKTGITGEGRCCIHMWHEWYDQPSTCNRSYCCYKCCWPSAIRLLLIFGPIVTFCAVVNFVIYRHDRMTVYRRAMETSKGQVRLDINRAVSFAYPSFSPYYSLFAAYGAVSFVYISALLVWPSNSLEACLSGGQGAELPSESGAPLAARPLRLYTQLNCRYKNSWHRFHYGEGPSPLSIFTVGLGVKASRLSHLMLDTLTLIPLVTIMAGLFNFDHKLYGLLNTSKNDDSSDTKSIPEHEKTQFVKVIQVLITLIIWFGFLSLTLGSASFLFIILQLLLNIVFFFFIGAFTQSCNLQTYILIFFAVLFYLNRELGRLNKTMAYILRLIDEYSPRVTATCDQPEVAFSDRSVQILKAHNLGAVKFIDSDNGEFVSKELYYGVARSLGYSWSYIGRRLLTICSILTLYCLAVLFAVTAFGEAGPNVAATPIFIGTAVLLALPALLCRASYWRASGRASGRGDQVEGAWSLRMADVLDSLVRYDRDSQAITECERELTTYDVRPVGSTEYERPRILYVTTSVSTRLDMWVYSPTVSVQRAYDGVTPQSDAGVALAVKMAAGWFATRSVNLPTPATTDQRDPEVAKWTELVEASVLNGVKKAAQFTDPPNDTLQWFHGGQSDTARGTGMVRKVTCGDSLVGITDSVYAALSKPRMPAKQTSDVLLVTVGNSSIAVVRYDDALRDDNSLDNNGVLDNVHHSNSGRCLATSTQFVVFSASYSGDQSISNSHGARLARGALDTPTLQHAMRALLGLQRVSVAACLEDVELLLFVENEESNSDDLEIL